MPNARSCSGCRSRTSCTWLSRSSIHSTGGVWNTLFLLPAHRTQLLPERLDPALGLDEEDGRDERRIGQKRACLQKTAITRR